MRLLPEPAPTLPPFKSLLVHGPYVPSSPVHLSLSVPPPNRTIFFTPSRDTLLHALRSDRWLITHAGTGTVAAMSSRVTLFYPSTPRHLIAVLAMLRTHDLSSPSVPVTPGMTLDRPPNLLVLHEPSAYFSHEQECTLSSYLLLIAHALATTEYLSSPSSISTARLVVFDSGLDRLRLPVLRPPHETTFGERDGPEDAPRPEPVLLLAEKYFELSGTFQYGDLNLNTPMFALHRAGEAVVQGETQKVSESAEDVVG